MNLFFKKKWMFMFFSLFFIPYQMKKVFEGAFIIFFSYKARSCIILNLIITIVSQRCIKICSSSNILSKGISNDMKRGHFIVLKVNFATRAKLITLTSVDVLPFVQPVGVCSFTILL